MQVVSGSFLKSLIGSCIQLTGGRLAGSEQERKGQQWFADLLSQQGAKINWEPFQARFTAKFHLLKIFSVLGWLSLGLAIALPLLGIGLALFNAIIFIMHFFLNKKWLHLFFPVGESANVTATFEPQGEVKRTLLFSGHMDSAREFVWWYYFKKWGLFIMLFGGVLLILLPIILTLLYFFRLEINPKDLIPIWVLTISWLSLVFMHGWKISPGAQDNLSGIVTAYGAALGLLDANNHGKTILQHTRIVVVSFAAEEGGMQGSKKFAIAHPELANEHTRVINLDGIMYTSQVHVVEKEFMSQVTFDAQVCQSVSQSLKEVGIEPKPGHIPIGGTDGASLQRAGIPTTSIVALRFNTIDPTYHTRLDLPEAIENQALEKVAQALTLYAIKWDKETIG
ncbi:MAG: M28 family metallopeptidase [Bacteroidia bacterium]|nr:M28 family metallopeptidase [Bacteroidia bacterium]